MGFGRTPTLEACVIVNDGSGKVSPVLPVR